jgi:hypothetical protein
MNKFSKIKNDSPVSTAFATRFSLLADKNCIDTDDKDAAPLPDPNLKPKPNPKPNPLRLVNQMYWILKTVLS